MAPEPDAVGEAHRDRTVVISHVRRIAMSRTIRVAATLAAAAIAALPFSALSASGTIQFTGRIVAPTQAPDAADIRQLIHSPAAAPAYALKNDQNIVVRPMSEVVSAQGTTGNPLLDYYVSYLRERAIDLKDVSYIVTTYP
jgi:hypothetical protein